MAPLFVSTSIHVLRPKLREEGLGAGPFSPIVGLVDLSEPRRPGSSLPPRKDTVGHSHLRPRMWPSANTRSASCLALGSQGSQL